MASRASSVLTFIFDNSLLLIAGTVIAIVWANVDASGYERLATALRFAVNDIGMVFFFALAAKEVFEATLPGGPLASPRHAASPIAAALGGMAAPALIYSTLVSIYGPAALGRGWAIPCATDIAFSALIARIVFPRRHPAIPFLLLLAIADDAIGLVILALFYPSKPVSMAVLVLVLALACFVGGWFRRRSVQSFWAYVAVPGVLSWIALYVGGLHPALAMVPIVPFMPHGATDPGLFEKGEESRGDTLNRFEHWWARPVQVVLFLFGLANAGVPFGQVGPGTWFVLAGLIVGKPLGIVLFAVVAGRGGARLPRGIGLPDLVTIGVAASVGFTVALFFATAAFSADPELAETKMGALLSFGAVPLALLVSRLMRTGQPGAVRASATTRRLQS